MGKPQLKRTLRSLESVRSEAAISSPQWLRAIVALVAVRLFARTSSDASNARALAWLDSLAPDFSDSYRSLFLGKASLGRRVRNNIDHFLNTQEGKGDDLLAWCYQYLNEQRADHAFSRTLKQGRKLSGTHLLAATQFFTDDYMVRYLVVDALKEGLATETKLENIRFFDPACGGGNFLTQALRRLVDVYGLNGAKRRKAVDTLLSTSIGGYDLDSQLAVVAKMNLSLQAIALGGSDTVVPLIFSPVGNDRFGFLRDGTNEDSAPALAAALDWWAGGQKKFIATNPPFAGRRDVDPLIRDYLKRALPSSAGDLCVAFMQRALRLLSAGDSASFVCQSSWLYLRSFTEFRKWLLSEYRIEICIELGTGAFADIGGEKTSVALVRFSAQSNSHKAKFLRLAGKSYTEKAAILFDGRFEEVQSFSVDQTDFLRSSDYGIRYHLVATQSSIRIGSHYSDFAVPMQGTSTGDNERFVQFAWACPDDANWRAVSKGGGYCKWAGLNFYKVLWGKDAEFIRKNPGAAVRNLEHMQGTDLVYSDTGSLGLNVRLMRPGQVFIASGPGIRITSGDKYAHLAFLNSKFATFQIRSLSPKLTISAGYIGRIPTENAIFHDSALVDSAKQCVELKNAYLARKVRNPEYSPSKSDLALSDHLIEKALLTDLEEELRRLETEARAEELINEHLGLTTADRELITEMVGLSPLAFSSQPEVPAEALDELLSRMLDTTCEYRSYKRPRGISKMGCEGPLEELAFHFQASPKAIMKLVSRNVRRLELSKRRYAEDRLQKNILSLLGFRSIYQFKKKSILLKNVKDRLFAECPKLDNSVLALLGYPNFEDWIEGRFNEVHRQSFFGQPLFFFDNDSLAFKPWH